MPVKKYLAEFLGAFLLTLAVSVSIKVGSAVPTPVVAGLTLGMGVYFLGSVSGAHFNPAITIALAAIKKMDYKTAFFYVVSQILGAALAILVIKYLFIQTVNVTNANSLPVFFVEALGAFVLAMGVSSVVHGKVKEDASGFVIGGSLLLGIMLTTSISSGILNPAVAVGLQGVSVAYMLGPIVGASAAMFLYRWFMSR